jgi:hypothetical protein
LDDNVNGILNMGTQAIASFIVFNRATCAADGIVVTADVPWLEAGPPEFDIGPAGSAGNETIVVSVDRGSLAPGQQSGVVTVAPQSGPAVRVTVMVAGPTPTPTATPTPTPTATSTPTATPSPIPDLVAPSLALVSCVVQTQTVTVRASAADPSGVEDVFLTWTDGPTARLSLSSGSETNGVWAGSAGLTSPPPSQIHLIAFDEIGNRADVLYEFTAECF